MLGGDRRDMAAVLTGAGGLFFAGAFFIGIGVLVAVGGPTFLESSKRRVHENFGYGYSRHLSAGKRTSWIIAGFAGVIGVAAIVFGILLLVA